jgi:hypothetical protein
MEPSPSHNPVSPEALELGYQPEAVPVRGLFRFLVIFVASTLILVVLIWWMMTKLESHIAALETPQSVFREGQLPPAPQLQPSVGHDAVDSEDLAAMRRRESEMFAKLGWMVRPGASNPEIPPEIIRRVAEEQRARAAAAFVPPTTTGRNSNSIIPTTIPARDTRPTLEGGPRR